MLKLYGIAEGTINTAKGIYYSLDGFVLRRREPSKEVKVKTGCAE